MNLAQLQGLLLQGGWPNVTVSSRSGQVPLIALMASIALAESSGNPYAHNPRGEDSVGLLQINRNAHPGYTVAQLQDPLFNVQVALQIYQIEGLRAWGAYTDGRYLGDGQFSQSLALYGGESAHAGSDDGYENFFGIPVDYDGSGDNSQFFNLNDYVNPANPFDVAEKGTGTLLIAGVIALVVVIVVTR